jgi:hypothetical protein
MRAAEPQLGAEEESLRKEEPSEREAVSREERSRAAAAEREVIRGKGSVGKGRQLWRQAPEPHHEVGPDLAHRHQQRGCLSIGSGSARLMPARLAATVSFNDKHES